ncbi:metallophosphoesterase family protein [Methylobacterium pseudosasicola]|uniref:Calcineurin-like phosphoesterase superfamily protein n=1 Tax=Methylobacterium pseudosasicola TaxID=582667 RepID=A0A1I4PT43_9HYPH|nr:metallophosphoesterase [Methylobacterium pseudosasicola]SFM30736.1 Calcineurin-like phosphoesterase superfamily protein [Methylobacterium pseudosasicola]
MPPKIHFVADTHWHHRSVLSPRLGLNRPFASIEEHDVALIANWNAAVGPDDTVWHLGDFSYRCPEDLARGVFSRLNGRRRFLVRGNHDKSAVRLPWDGIVDVARVVVPLIDGTGQGVWCSHYAHRVWPRQHRGDIHLYGHSHGTLPGTAASTDVGVDCFGFRPITLDEIRVRLAENAARDGGRP